jgi:hypothetical protein
MKKWTWVLLFVGVAALLMLITRENFQTGSAPEPTCSTPGMTVIDGWCKTPNVPLIPPPPCPAGSTLSVGKCRGSDSMTAAQAAAAGLTYNSFTNQYTKDAKSTCPDGYAESWNNDCEILNKSPPICSNGYVYMEMQGKCALPAAAAGPPGGLSACQTEIATKQWSEVSAACKASANGAGAAPGGNTTGGSSTTAGSNSGGTASGTTKKGNIWGPAFTGLGDNAGDGSGSSLRDYPTLLGPKPKESRMVEGAGIANISQAEKLVKSGVLPGAKSTGSDPDSQFFGSSRSPGDKDLFPNPYQEFTPSVGSSKTEPVPYLSDFSAFAK